MPSSQNNQRNQSSARFNKIKEISELDLFKKKLEKHFFSKVTIRNYSNSNSEVSLIIEMDCNLELLEVLHHFNKKVWGNFSSQRFSFAGAFMELQHANEFPIAIEEFSLFLEDTSIIVNRIYSQSIPGQLENIFTTLSNHSIHFTKGMSEIPYEIYVSVFEGNAIESENKYLKDLESICEAEQSYFSFWGLYFSSQEDAAIYDLKNHTLINGKLQMLNR